MNNHVEDKRFARGHLTSEALIQVGREILSEGISITDVTIDDLCGRCRVTKGAFFHHFRGKEEFFDHVLAIDESEYMSAVIDKADIDHPGDPAKQIEAWIEGLVNYVMKRGRNAVTFHIATTMKDTSVFVDGWTKRVDDHLLAWQRSGCIRADVSITEMHQYLDSFTYGMTMLAAQEYIQLPLEPRLVQGFISTIARI